MSSTRTQAEQAQAQAQLALATAMLRVLVTRRLPDEAMRADLWLHVHTVTERADARW